MRVITGSARGMALKAPKGMDTRRRWTRSRRAFSPPFSLRSREDGCWTCSQAPGRWASRRSAGARNRRSLSICARMPARSCAKILPKHGWSRTRGVVRADYLSYLASARETFDLIFLDPPYAEVFLENSLKRISEIDILSDSGIIITERPFGKELPASVPGLVRCRDYRYGKAAVTIYRKPTPQEDT